jgi:hypothetical protein
MIPITHIIMLKSLFAMLLTFCLAVTLPLGAQEQKPEEAKVTEEVKKAEEAQAEDKPAVSFSVDVLNQYVWRGLGLSRGSVVVQPSVTLTYKGLTANVWGNWDGNERNPFGITTPNRKNPKWNETDFTLSYSREVLSGLTLTAGMIYYALDSNNSTQDSFELYGGFNYTFPTKEMNWFDIGFAGYREVSHFPGWYLEWYITRTFNLPIAGASINLYSSWSAELSSDRAVFPTTNGNYYNNLHAGQLRAVLNIPVGKYVTVSPKIIYWYALGGQSTPVIRNLSWDTKQNHVVGGVSIAVAF